MGLPLKKNPSHVAQAETPRPPRPCGAGASPGTPSHLAEAPEAMIRVSALISCPSSVQSLKGAEASGLLLELLHQLRALYAFGEARIVLDLGGDGELAAGLRAVDDEGLQVRAGGIDGGGQARRAGADDDHLAVLRLFRHAGILDSFGAAVCKPPHAGEAGRARISSLLRGACSITFRANVVEFDRPRARARLFSARSHA
jgi:hypothetical protein